LGAVGSDINVNADWGVEQTFKDVLCFFPFLSKPFKNVLSVDTMATPAETANTTRVPTPTSHDLGHDQSPSKHEATEKGANVPTHVAPGKHEAHASLPGANSAELTDEEKRLAQMPTGLRLYLIMLGLML